MCMCRVDWGEGVKEQRRADKAQERGRPKTGRKIEGGHLSQFEDASEEVLFMRYEHHQSLTGRGISTCIQIRTLVSYWNKLKIVIDA